MKAQPPPDSPTTLPYLATSFHGIVLLMALLVIGLSFAMRADDYNRVYMPGIQTALPETCLTKQVIEMDCPGCGMTRAFIQISHGHPRQAITLNAASPVVYAFFLIQIPWHAMQLCRIRNRTAPVNRWWTVIPILAACTTLIGCWWWKHFL